MRKRKKEEEVDEEGIDGGRGGNVRWWVCGYWVLVVVVKCCGLGLLMRMGVVVGSSVFS